MLKLTLSRMGAPTQAMDRAMLQRWLPYCRLDAVHPKVLLLCFAHAGGSALVFYKWPARLPRTVRVCAVQLPGREQRLGEPFIKRMPQLMEKLSRELIPHLDRPVALLGHSLGAKIAFEFARRMESQPGTPEILHLFVSGSPAPHLPTTHDRIYSLPEEEFAQRLREFGGTPKELLSDSSVMQFLAPRLRSDFELDDTYEFEPGEPLICPITAWTGDADPIIPADLIKPWAQHTRGKFRSQILQGAHFALYQQDDEVLSQMRLELSCHLSVRL